MYALESEGTAKVERTYSEGTGMFFLCFQVFDTIYIWGVRYWLHDYKNIKIDIAFVAGGLGGYAGTGTKESQV